MGLFSFDKQFYDQGYRTFAGVDEAGRGPWAGPVVASAVISSAGNITPRAKRFKKSAP